MPTAEDLLAWARAWLHGRGWAWEEDQGDVDTIFRVRPETSGDHWNWYLQVHTATRQVTLLSVLPSHVPSGRRPAVAEFVLRATYGMNVGGFEMDLDDGEVRFRTALGLGRAEIDQAEFEGLLNEMARTNAAMTDGYLPGIVGVLEGESPLEAVRIAEG